MEKLTGDELNSLRTLHHETQKAEAEQRFAQAQMSMVVTKLFIKHDMVQGKHLICLHCGTFQPTQTGCDCSPTK